MCVNSSSALNRNYLGFAEGKINMTLSFKEAGRERGNGNNSTKKKEIIEDNLISLVMDVCVCVSVYSMGINRSLKSKNGQFSNSLSNLQIEIKKTNDLKNIPLNHLREVVVGRKRDTPYVSASYESTHVTDITFTSRVTQVDSQ